MTDSVVRDAVKQAMKLWIVVSERVRVRAAELREDLEDVVVEAREEYRLRAQSDERPDDEDDGAVAAAPKQGTAPRRPPLAGTTTAGGASRAKASA